jgi:hypothetical protein
MDRDPYEAAIDQILEGADGDTRLALRIMLVQRLELEARLLELTERLAVRGLSTPVSNKALN